MKNAAHPGGRAGSLEIFHPQTDHKKKTCPNEALSKELASAAQTSLGDSGHRVDRLLLHLCYTGRVEPLGALFNLKLDLYALF